jgi:hypothetical protein
MKTNAKRRIFFFQGLLGVSAKPRGKAVKDLSYFVIYHSSSFRLKIKNAVQ